MARRRSETTLSDWSCLPCDLLELICSKIRHESDLIRFKAVCKSWELVDTAPPNFIIPLFPLQLSDKTCDSSRRSEFWEMTTTLDGNKMIISKKTNLPSYKYLYSVSFTQGWIVFKDFDGHVVLENPFSSPPALRIRLPRFHFPVKVVAAADPLDANCSFLGIPRSDCGGLRFCNAGDKEWQTLHTDIGGRFRDIIFYNNHFYALHITEIYVLVDSKLIPCGSLTVEPKNSRKYLVESSGNLLLVFRSSFKPTPSFQISKLDLDTREWVKVTSLDDHISLLLTYNSNNSFSTKDFPGLRGNSIFYFAFFMPGGIFKLCSFDLKTQQHEIIVEAVGFDHIFDL